MAITVVPTKQCGFCATGHHDRCSVGVKYSGQQRHAKWPGGVVWTCSCIEGECTSGRRKCAYCNNRTTEQINPETWECFDMESCRATVEARREADPLHVQLREIEETVKMAKIEDNKTKTAKKAVAKTPVPCTCGCGDNTKGGKFLPGHDARYVSERVTQVINGKFAAKVEQTQRARIKKDNVSDALVAKFEKSLGLAKDKAERRAADKEAKDKAKAEKANA